MCFQHSLIYVGYNLAFVSAHVAAGRDWFLGMQLAWHVRVAKSLSSSVAGVEPTTAESKEVAVPL